jgi:hypothetical protein
MGDFPPAGERTRGPRVALGTLRTLWPRWALRTRGARVTLRTLPRAIQEGPC